jgi:hypothetical protein
MDNYLEITDDDFNKLTTTFTERQVKKTNFQKELQKEKDEDFIKYVLKTEKIETKQTKKEILENLVDNLKNDMNKTENNTEKLNEKKLLNIIK